MSEDDESRDPLPEGVRCVRLGHGANCSSIGSVVDTLFATAAVSAAVFAAVVAALSRETVTTTRGNEPTTDRRPRDERSP